ncbi:MAG: ANTAR domain-containing protein [Ruminococcus sp.]|nr:ANTAR domain-containing protein [Ruminococcus sp.]MDE7097724.1 ANTAR domain-containing protein [Ruminococcus sp.]
MNKAIIVSQPCETAELIELTIKNSGFVTYSVTGGNEIRRIIKNNYNPDLIIINTPLSDEFGYELAEMTAEETNADIILICSGDISAELTDMLSYSGITMLSKPITREILLENINSSRFSEIKESDDILNKIENIRTINRAKSLLMKYLKFTEPQAHKYIVKQAMNNRCTRLEAAEKIINTYEK